jgi:hypothetical protein
MNLFDYELLDQVVSNFEASLKEVDKFYPNEKSLANYFDAMSEKPLDDWKRFEPIKGDSERIALQNLSHFGAAILTFHAKIYNDAEETKSAAIELLEENKRLKDKIHDLKASENHWFQAFLDCNQDSIQLNEMFLKTISKEKMTV